MRKASADRLTYLDGLRGVAALMVALFSHYGHFAQTSHSGISMAQAPGYWFLAPLYGYSWTAVELFFAISGVVFAYVYADRLPGAFDFAARRFARLYPLHLVTLAVVAVLVLIFQQVNGRSPAYDNNDLMHFAMNVAFVHNGLISENWSFNGPSYSLAIEAVMYLTFYVAARYTDLDITAWLLFIGATLFLALPHPWHHLPVLNNSIAIGVVGFFGGVIVFRGGRTAYLLPVILAATTLLSGSLFTKVYTVIFSVMLLFACSEHLRIVFSKSLFTWLGKRSLSIYLVHFPLQVAIMLVLGTKIPFGSYSLLLTYALLLLLVSHAAHHLIEQPAQVWIRRLSEGANAQDSQRSKVTVEAAKWTSRSVH